MHRNQAKSIKISQEDQLYNEYLKDNFKTVSAFISPLLHINSETEYFHQWSLHLQVR